MSEVIDASSALSETLERIWFTRCPVPTATGLAYRLGWLQEEFARDGLSVSSLQDNPPSGLRKAHFTHELPGLFREGGNVPALAARAEGAPSRLIGLTWIDEWQTILVRPGTGISDPAQLKGLRLAVPAYADSRGGSIARAMTLQGFKGALSSAGLGFEDVILVEVPLSASVPGNQNEGLQRLWSGIEYLAAGKVDAVYVKGAAAVDAARRFGVVVGIDLDSLGDRRFRVNNGTPRPITVHQNLLDEHFDLVVRFLHQALRAADWAASHKLELSDILESETRSGAEGVAAAYRGDFHLHLHPTLSPDRIGFLREQKDFLLLHGFLEHDVDIDAWIDTRPLQAAVALHAASSPQTDTPASRLSIPVQR